MGSGLAAHIKKFVGLSEAEEAILLGYTRQLEIKKKTFLLKEGQVCKTSFFVEKGCLRLFFINEKGAEQTAQFAIENWWLADYASFCSGAPSQFFIQAVENSKITMFEKLSQDELYAKLPQLERYFRHILEKSYGAAQWRIKYIFSLSKEDQYRHFISSYPEFVQRIPQYMLASFLGLTPEYLSEIRKKKA
ncbi:MAG: Crp/Fnr family transcriptional regulator [Chitinophagaceae bacterium]